VLIYRKCCRAVVYISHMKNCICSRSPCLRSLKCTGEFLAEVAQMPHTSFYICTISVC
jgi:hypothetical protein